MDFGVSTWKSHYGQEGGRDMERCRDIGEAPRGRDLEK